MRTITITTYASMSNRFRVWHSGGGRSFGRDAAGGAGEAAAIAMEYARTGGPYIILGHKDALNMIPEELRYKAA